jgi:hypothetical protein
VKREAAVKVAQSFVGPGAGAFAFAVWPVLGKLDWGVLMMDMRNGDTRLILDDTDTELAQQQLGIEP